MARKCILVWLSSIKARSIIKKIFIKELAHEKSEIRVIAIRGLEDYLKPEIMFIFLDQLEKHLDIEDEREALIDLLELSSLLKSEQNNLFYDSKLFGKKREALRCRMVHVFRKILDQFGVYDMSVSPYEFMSMILHSEKLVSYLAYFKDSSATDWFWSLLEYKKQESFYSNEQVKLYYKRLYKQAPFFTRYTIPKKACFFLYTSVYCFSQERFFP